MNRKPILLLPLLLLLGACSQGENPLICHWNKKTRNLVCPEEQFKKQIPPSKNDLQIEETIYVYNVEYKKGYIDALNSYQQNVCTLHEIKSNLKIDPWPVGDGEVLKTYYYYVCEEDFDLLLKNTVEQLPEKTIGTLDERIKMGLPSHLKKYSPDTNPYVDVPEQLGKGFTQKVNPNQEPKQYLSVYDFTSSIPIEYL